MLLGLLATPALAADIYVHPTRGKKGGTKEKPFRYLADALKKAQPGDTLHLAAGTHKIEVRLDGETGSEVEHVHLTTTTDDADIRIDKTEVSRCHATITIQGTTAGRVVAGLRELARQLGVFEDRVAGHPDRPDPVPHALAHGDVEAAPAGAPKTKCRRWRSVSRREPTR